MNKKTNNKEKTETERSSENESPDQLFNFFERLKNISSIKRFGTLPMIQFESVAAHSYNVAILALLIADHEPEGTVNKEVLLKKALFHDFEESILSDIPHTIKHRYKGGELGKLLKNIVPDLIEEEIFKELPHSVRSNYVHYSLTAKEGLEGQMVEAADAMDTMVTCVRELKLGNRYFENVFDISLKLVSKYTQFKFVSTFLEQAVHYVKDSTKPNIEKI